MGQIPQYQVKPQTRSLLRFLFKLRWVGWVRIGLMVLGFIVGLVAALRFGWWGALLAIIPFLSGAFWPVKR